MKQWLKILPLIIIIIFVSGCTRAARKFPLKPSESFKSVSVSDVDFIDDLDQASLEAAIERSIHYYEKAGRNKVYRISNRQVDAKQLKETLTAFRSVLRDANGNADLRKKIAAEFNLYQVSGPAGVLFTGYYEPLLEGSLSRTDRYKYPLYRVPPDLIKKEGRVGRMKNGKLIPYYSRREIDIDGVLKDKNLELVWVADPVELFSLHIQGSGRIKLENGNILKVGFAQTNDRPFSSVTKFMLEGGKINSSEASYRHEFLRGKSDREIYEVLSHNERYTFFRILDKDPVGSLGEPVTPGRTIATDPDFFPEGALAFIRLPKSAASNGGNGRGKNGFSRFVLSQDKGKAIEGPGRVDLFCGFGEQAEYTAGTLKERGDLYLLLKK